MSKQRAYQRIADHYRQLIQDGALRAGDRLPTVKEMAQEHGVATATIVKALGQLQVEEHIRTSPRGTLVADESPGNSSGRDRLDRVTRTGSLLSAGETQLVTAAQLVVSPLYVADIFGLDAGDQVVRREAVIGRANQRLALLVTWYPAEFAVMVPDLLSTAPSKAAGLLPRILDATGRRVTHARDDMHAREADEREARALGMRTGAPTLAGAHRWSDDDGVIEYGEWCLPTLHVIGYHYSLDGS
nr:GntR family transcriptional regulator [Allostreptomyces psammosilenae]